MHTTRINDYTIQVDDAHQTKIFANERLHLERTALDELETFGQIDGIKHLSFTPDFHKGSGTPVGTVALIDRVYPRVTGNDIGCGMRLDVLNIKDLEITPELADRLRHAFFAGGREVLVEDRARLLAEGLACPIQGKTGERVSRGNSYAQGTLGEGEVSPVLAPYLNISSSRDNLLGSIGGGNHFVELQMVDEIVDAQAAYRCGLRRGSVCVMVHSGSLDNGHQVGEHFKDLAKSKWLGKYPENGFFYLHEEDCHAYAVASNNAANFAMVNRAVMSAMVGEVLDCSLTPVYDAPHNFVVEHQDGFLHRKGACPAALDELVIIPGSMGSRSFLGLGCGFQGTLSSAPHGAGRVLSRNQSRAQQNDFEGIQLVTKVDPTRVRADIAREVMKGLGEEAPRAYKDIAEVVWSSEAAGMVRAVAWLKPLLTIKG